MNESIESCPGATGQESGPSLLRQAREAAGLHIAVLAVTLKVPVRKLEALEAGHYHELPDLTFARALASSACRQLKIDPAPILEHIPMGHSPVLGGFSHGINTPFTSIQEASTWTLAGAWKRPSVLLTLALVLAALGLYYMPDWRQTADALSGALSNLSPSRTVSSDDVAPKTTAIGSSAQTASAAAATAADRPAALPVVAKEAAPVAAANEAVPDAAPPAGEAPVQGLLTIKALGDSWVEVVDGKGALQVQRMIKTGDVLRFSGTAPYAVVLGRADLVEVRVLGKPFDVAPYVRNSVARFQVK
jgi:cytoskeleton protein RodZ